MRGQKLEIEWTGFPVHIDDKLWTAKDKEKEKKKPKDEVIEITVEIAAPLAAATETTDRLWGISYQVPDVERAVARLRRDGFDASEARAGRKPGTRVATVRGEPCGVATLLIEPAPR
jgi:hypothetical protein